MENKSSVKQPALSIEYKTSSNPFSNNKILIIDDEQVVIDSIRYHLKREGYEVLSAMNGKQGLEVCNKASPILIILDIRMPVMDGIQFLKHINPSPHDPYSVIVLTGHGDDEEIEKCFKMGISAFLSKPFNLYELKGLVKNSSKLKQTQLELKNEMKKHIQFEKELVEYEVKLEGMVEERTSKLKDVNSKLKNDLDDRKALEKKLLNEKRELQKAQEDLKNAYAHLKTSQAIILQQEKMAGIGQLAAGVAHEINNPIGFISSNLGTLGRYVEKLTKFITLQTLAISSLKVKEDLKEAEKELKLDYILKDIKELVKESIDGAHRVAKIVSDLKNFSRADGQEERALTDINGCIESTLNIIWNELKYKATVKRKYGKIPLTKCYPGQLSQVFMNIFINASQAIDKSGDITINSWQNEDSIFASISDTGCGIPKKNLSRIFDPFFTTKDVGMGTGLGMSISYEIIKKHNGEITAQSEVGKGTTFTVKLPIVA